MPIDTLQPCPTCGHPSDHEPACPDDVRPRHDPDPSQHRDPDPSPQGRPAVAAAPWTIPIRDPDPDIPRREATWLDQVSIVPLMAAVVGLFVLVVAAVVVMGNEAEPAGPEVAGSELTRDPATSVTTGPTTSAPGSPTSSLRTRSTVAPSTTATPEPADLPVLDPAVLSAGWVAQISSVPATEGADALSAAFGAVSRTVPEAVIVRGSEWPSLQGGSWVIVQPGFESGAAAVDACMAAGRADTDDCFGRYLDAGDATERVCVREPDGALRGDC